jgi:GT2 family glycosyltransferase
MANSSGTSSGAPGPVRVLVAEAGAEVPAIAATYVAALVFGVQHGRLIGELEVPLRGDGMSGAELGRRLRTAFGERWQATVPAAPASDLPYVSVVVATTMQRLDELDRCLNSLLALDYPDFEIILVDNRPDGSVARKEMHERLCADPRVRVVSEPRPGISAARNHGARVARADVVVFTDDDVVAHPGWLRGVGTRFRADPDVDCVSGVVLPAELETPAQIWFERSGSKLESRYQPVTFQNDGRWRGQRLGSLRRARFEIRATTPGGEPETHLVCRAGKFGMGANIALQRDAWRAIGGFDEALGTGTPARGGEDIDAIARLLHLGGRVTMDPAAIVLHYHRRDYAGSRHQMYGYGVGATAAMTALVRSDPRHLVGLGYMVLPGFRLLFGKSAGRRADNYPKELDRAELRGLLAGPFAYLRSRVPGRRHPTGT